MRDHRQTLRFATHLAPNMSSVYECAAEYVGRRLGLSTDLVIGGSFAAFERGEVEVGFHQKALRMVADRRADASAIDSQVLAIELRDHPALADLVCVIDALGPATIQPVVAARHVSDSLKDDLRAALWTMGAEGDDPSVRACLDHGFVARFIPVADTDYDDIRAMVAAAEAAGFATLR